MKFIKFLIPALAIIIPSVNIFSKPKNDISKSDSSNNDSIHENDFEEHKTILRRFSDSERFLQFAKHGSHGSHGSHSSHSSHSSGSHSSGSSGDCNGCAFNVDDELNSVEIVPSTVTLLK